MIPTLESERLLFRHHEPADLDAYCAMEADPEVRRYVGGAPRPRADAVPSSRNQERQVKKSPLPLIGCFFTHCPQN